MPGEPPRHFRDELHPRARDAYYVAQRVGWILLALFLLLAIVGLFGDGPIASSSTSSSADGVTVRLEYDRFARSRSPQSLRLSIDAPGATADRVAVTLSGDLADGIQVESTSPQGPEGAFVSDPVLEWRVDDWSEPLVVTVHYEAEAWWWLDGEVRVTVGDVSQSISISQLLFP